MTEIVVTLKRNRFMLGTLEVIEAGEIRFITPCLGRADRQMAAQRSNPARDPLRPFGDTPTGEYRILRLSRPAHTPQVLRTYGPNPLISIEGISGEALQAKQNGRSGLAQHGGALSNNNVPGRLRPTNGCIRVSDVAQAKVIELLPADLSSVKYTVQEA